MLKSRVVRVAFFCALLSGSVAAMGQAAAPAGADEAQADSAGPAGVQPATQSAPGQPATQPVAAPPAPAPAAAPARPGEESAEEMLRQMLQPQGETAEPLRPSDKVPTGADEAAQEPPTATGRPLVREGTPLLDRVGRLTPSADGKSFQVAFESDGRGLTEPPMILLPNRQLMQLENRLRTSYRDLKISVSGEVTEYRGKNYLLLSRWGIVQDVMQPLR